MSTLISDKPAITTTWQLASLISHLAPVQTEDWPAYIRSRYVNASGHICLMAANLIAVTELKGELLLVPALLFLLFFALTFKNVMQAHIALAKQELTQELLPKSPSDTEQPTTA